MVYKATFNLPDKSYYTGAVKGTGKAIGISNGSGNYGMYFYYASRTGDALSARTGALNANNGTSVAGDIVPGSDVAVGLATDPSYSNIIVEPDTQLKLCIKY